MIVGIGPVVEPTAADVGPEFGPVGVVGTVVVPRPTGVKAVGFKAVNGFLEGIEGPLVVAAVAGCLLANGFVVVKEANFSADCNDVKSLSRGPAPPLLLFLDGLLTSGHGGGRWGWRWCWWSLEGRGSGWW